MRLGNTMSGRSCPPLQTQAKQYLSLRLQVLSLDFSLALWVALYPGSRRGDEGSWKSRFCTDLEGSTVLFVPSLFWISLSLLFPGSLREGKGAKPEQSRSLVSTCSGCALQGRCENGHRLPDPCALTEAREAATTARLALFTIPSSSDEKAQVPSSATNTQGLVGGWSLAACISRLGRHS